MFKRVSAGLLFFSLSAFFASVEAALSAEDAVSAGATTTSTSPIEVLLFCGLMGLLGQGARAIVGLKTMQDYRTPADEGTVFDLARLLVSLVIGFVAGVVTALAIWGTAKGGDIAAAVPIGDFDTAMKFAVAGYIGTDAIEAFTVKYFDPPVADGQSSTASQNINDGKTAGGSAAAAAVPSGGPLDEKVDVLTDRVSMMDASVRSIPALVTAHLSSDVELPPFDQAVVDACAARTLSSASGLHDLFGGSFFAWYNVRFKGVADTKARFPCADTPLKRQRFDQFWDQIPAVFGKDSVSAIEFCALMAINLEESNGSFAANPEEVNAMTHTHPGLAYPFDAIPGLKQSYNRAPNLTALALFRNETYINAHGERAGRDRAKKGARIDPRWGGEIWPADVPADPVEAVNGFIMQADFYKFRGRGVIQTTWRSDYKLMIEWLLTDEAATNAALKTLVDRWKALTPQLEASKTLEAIATLSSNADWDAAFGESITLAKGVAIDSANKGDYLQKLSRSAAVLGADKTSVGSFLWFARHINGGDYPDRVAPIMKSLMRGVAGVRPVAPKPRLPDVPVA